MTDITPEKRVQLLNNITQKIVTGELSTQQLAEKQAEEERKRKNRQFSDTEGKRDSVIRPPTGVVTPKQWFPNGMVDRQSK